MKKLLCASMLALVPAFGAYAAEEQQQASANRNLAQECRAHTENGRMLKSMPDYMREDCARIASKERHQQPQNQNRHQANNAKQKRDKNPNQAAANNRENMDARQASQNRNNRENRDARDANQASQNANERNARDANYSDNQRDNNERREDNR